MPRRALCCAVADSLQRPWRVPRPCCCQHGCLGDPQGAGGTAQPVHLGALHPWLQQIRCASWLPCKTAATARQSYPVKVAGRHVHAAAASQAEGVGVSVSVLMLGPCAPACGALLMSSATGSAGRLCWCTGSGLSRRLLDPTTPRPGGAGALVEQLVWF